MSESRATVRFRSGDAECEAWLYRPTPHDSVSEPRPVVVMAHGLGGIKEMCLAAYAERFVGAGYVVLVFDYRHFGGSGGQPRQVLSARRQLGDWRAAIAYARSLPEVDPDLVVAWGTSFGGGHVLSVAASDPRLAAAIAQCPFTDGRASTAATPPATGLRLTAAALADLLGAARGRAPRYVAVAGVPGTTAFMTSPDALPGLRALSAGLDYDDRLAARSALAAMSYLPGRRASAITCPLFVALCEQDTVTPVGVAARQVARASHVELRRYPVGHFDIYLGEPRRRAITDYLEFLRAHVPVSAGARASG